MSQLNKGWTLNDMEMMSLGPNIYFATSHTPTQVFKVIIMWTASQFWLFFNQKKMETEEQS